MGEKQKLVSMVEAVAFLNELHNNNPEKSGRDYICKKTLYNAIHAKKLTPYGSRHFRQVDVNELVKIYGSKKSA